MVRRGAPVGAPRRLRDPVPPAAPAGFTPVRRGGRGTPLLLLHGFMETHRTWDLVRPALERHHDVIAPTLPGHAGGPPLPGDGGLDAVVDHLARFMDAEGLETAHVAGNSLGGYLALRLAARDRARSVVALAPAGGWAEGEPGREALLDRQRDMADGLRAAAPHADALVATPDGRRQATALRTVRWEHIPPELLAHQIRAAAASDVTGMTGRARRETWALDVAAVRCPVRIVWGTADRLLPWPAAAARYRRDLVHAEWVVLDDVGHAPQLDVPLEAAELILGATVR